MGLVAQGTQSLADIVTGHRPLTVLSFWGDHQVFGESPSGWHWTNLTLHLVNGVLVALLATALGISGWFAAGLFLLHPIQVEAVAYVNGRAELLVTCGILFALWAVTWKTRRLLGVLLGALIAATSKESAVVLAGLLPLVWWIR